LSNPESSIGFEHPFEGESFARIVLYSTTGDKEYLEIPQTSNLQSGAIYQVECYLSLTESSEYTTNEVGCYFSQDSILGFDSDNNLPLESQLYNTTSTTIDTSGWTLFRGFYQSNGGESYLTIGNFKSNDQSNVLFTETNPIYGSFSRCAVCVDNVSVVEIPSGLDEDIQQSHGLIIYPNPFQNEIIVSSLHSESKDIKIIDLMGKEILKKAFVSKLTLETTDLDEGMYLYEIWGDNKLLKVGRVVKE